MAYAVSQSLTGSVSSGKSKTSFSELLQYKPKMLKRILNAKKICKKEKRELLPKDLFHLKGFMVAGTDNQCYKDDLEENVGSSAHGTFCGNGTFHYRNRDLDQERNVLFPGYLLL